MKKPGLAAKLIYWILPCSAIIIVAAFAYNYYFSQQAVLREVAENARNLSRATAFEIEAILRGVEKVPINLAAAVEDNPPELTELLRLTRNATANNDEIYGVCIAFEPYAYNPKSKYFAPYYYRKDGVITLDWGSYSYQYWYWDWYQIPKELRRSLWSEPYFDEGSGDIIMSTFSVPFYKDVNGLKEFQGVVTADISLLRLQEIISEVKIYRRGYAFLLSANGAFVTHPDKQKIMRETIFSVAEGQDDPDLRRIGREMIQGRAGLVPLKDFFTGKQSWMYYTPLPSAGWSLGVIFPEDELFAVVRNLSHKILLIGFLGLVFLGVVIIAISGSITKPLRKLARQTAAIAQGDFNATVPESGAREIAHLAQSFNQMGRQLTDYIEKRDFIRDTFGRYVTQEVVKRLLESQGALELGGETREVSILISDLRGFTALTADMHPEEVITFLNRYLGKMIEILVDYRAVIDEIIGDGILAFFGAPEPLEDHPARAVACALSMQAAMEEINALNAADGLPHLEMGIAVNTGQVVVGNIGSEKRTKYSVVGAHVNLASRIEAYAVGGQVLISPATYERVKDLIEVRGTIQAQMKGIPGTATIYNIRSIRGPYNLSLKERGETLIPLPERLKAEVFHLEDKIIIGASREAWITHICETSAELDYDGELSEWEEVRIILLDENLAARPGKIYGKVSLVQPGGSRFQKVTVRFTSVSPETFQFIHKLVGPPAG